MSDCSSGITTTSFRQSPYGKNWIACINGIDVDESCDGYTAAELRELAERFNHYASVLDKINSIVNTPSLFDSVGDENKIQQS